MPAVAAACMVADRITFLSLPECRCTVRNCVATACCDRSGRLIFFVAKGQARLELNWIRTITICCTVLGLTWWALAGRTCPLIFVPCSAWSVLFSRRCRENYTDQAAHGPNFDGPNRPARAYQIGPARCNIWSWSVWFWSLVLLVPDRPPPLGGCPPHPPLIRLWRAPAFQSPRLGGCRPPARGSGGR